MNRLGIHALVWAGDTSTASVEHAVAGTVAAGYELLEFSLHDTEHFDTAHARRVTEEAGLQVVCSRGLAAGADVSSDDPGVVARGADLLAESIRVTAELGGTLLTGALYSAFGKFPRPISAAGRANAVSALRDAAAEASRRGITLGLEVCNRYETNVINTATQALELADDVGADNVVIHLDTYHMNIEESDFRRPVHDTGERLGYVHIGENHRGYLGSGHLPFPDFFHALVDSGYTGAITFESFSSAIGERPLLYDLAIWRDLWDDGADLAAHARRFIADGMAAARS
ncbi:MAG TPA: sugar phosphate isomerase/epimerase [Mycobacteriales bacterium]|nr:sugar phosphate isomerase/epimerase [Mycobacteriales bacterium]